uniref:LIM zinc-binding domain-containing protein n=1 Tax=Syphacia muris TaxID=451379 RepID=A0A0N5ABC1_9BILA
MMVVCHRPFETGSFYDYNGVPLCETHYHEKRGSLCAVCNKPISGRCVSAMGQRFHPEHFCCSYCRKQLNKGTFKEGEAYFSRRCPMHVTYYDDDDDYDDNE